ncbi:MAG TPA: D-alanyl-D-alanine endopeptidase [Acidobacteriota bacterium]|nr:D-alanyl-D-alanine endopeptidase [Acidobacteriota bacterium]
MTLKSRIISLVLLVSGFSFNLSAGPIAATPLPKLRSAAVLVKDQRTGEFLMVKRADVAMPIASLTKLMTAMVVLDAHLDMDQVITVEEADKDRLRNSHSHLQIGTKLTRREALLVALMASENRAARALGRTFPGGIQALVKAMNNKAKALGLSETKFEDPAGLSDSNVSSAQDLSKIVEAACGYPLICMYSTETETTIRSGKRTLHFMNTNALVRNPNWQIGLSKTGYIEEAGRCLVMQTQVGQRPVLMVLLNSTGKNSRLGDANRIKQWLEGPPPKPSRKPHR